MNMIRWAAIPAAAAISLGAAACGSGGSHTSAAPPPAPATLAKEIRAAIQHASSVHVSGSGSENGTTMTVNLSMTRSGGMSGQISVSGAGFTVLSTHGSSYIKVTGAFLKYAHLPTAACSMMCGRYLKLPPAEAQSLAGGLSMRGMGTGSFMGITMNGSPNFRIVGTANVNGQRAWVLRDSDGSTAYVASSGTAYPLRVVAPPSKQGRLDFTQWNSVTIPPPPPASQVVDLSKLHA